MGCGYLLFRPLPGRRRPPIVRMYSCTILNPTAPARSDIAVCLPRLLIAGLGSSVASRLVPVEHCKQLGLALLRGRANRNVTPPLQACCLVGIRASFELTHHWMRHQQDRPVPLYDRLWLRHRNEESETSLCTGFYRTSPPLRNILPPLQRPMATFTALGRARTAWSRVCGATAATTARQIVAAVMASHSIRCRSGATCARHVIARVRACLCASRRGAGTTGSCSR